MNIGTGNVFIPGGTKPLAEPMLIIFHNMLVTLQSLNYDHDGTEVTKPVM